MQRKLLLINVANVLIQCLFLRSNNNCMTTTKSALYLLDSQRYWAGSSKLSDSGPIFHTTIKLNQCPGINIIRTKLCIETKMENNRKTDYN